MPLRASRLCTRDATAAAPQATVSGYVAARHGMGVAVFYLSLFLDTGMQARWSKAWHMQSTADIMALAWNAFLPNELLFARDNGALFSIVLPDPESACGAETATGLVEEAVASTNKEAWHCQACVQVMAAIDTHDPPGVAQPMSVACAGHARRALLACGTALLVGQV